MTSTDPMTQEEFEARDRRLAADVDAAYQAFNRARDLWDSLSQERRELRHQWRQQHNKDGEW
ncbi:hypothetical protein ACIQNU_04355 [Streptomyces sp. NPDC091292]|uniref:hypothetical protein n=1 Tax=Streptomyces sp. NPDC091292 TaxID=3365991 RepID=UPI0037F38E66